MTGPGGRADTTTARIYVRRLEQEVRLRSARAAVFSHRDWDLARRWHDDGIPLGLILEILEERGTRPIRGLGSIAAKVEDTWRVVRAGSGERTTVSERAGDGPWPDGDRRRETLRAVAAVGEPALREVLLDLVRSVADGDVEDAIDDALARDAPDPWMREVEAAVDRDLAPHRGTMPPARLAETRRRAIADGLRRRAGLPRRGGPPPREPTIG